MLMERQAPTSPLMTHNAEVLRLLLGSSIFRSLGERLQPLSRASFTRTVEFGAPLFHAGQRAEHLLLVLSGLLKIVRHTEDGTETILGIFGAKEPVGLLPVLQQGPHTTTAFAMTERVRVLCIPGVELLRLASADTAIALALNHALLLQNQLLHDTIHVLSAGAVPQRLAALLLTLAERFGDEMEDGTVRIPVVLSRGELSSLISARSETTIRTFTRWRKQGILETTREGFVLPDPLKLAEILGGART